MFKKFFNILSGFFKHFLVDKQDIFKRGVSWRLYTHDYTVQTYLLMRDGVYLLFGDKMIKK